MEQTAQQIQFLERTITNTETENLMISVIDIYHLQTGREHDPLQHPRIKKYTDSAWLKQLTTAIVQFNITIFRKKRIIIP